jgi:hypothetical protein
LLKTYRPELLVNLEFRASYRRDINMRKVFILGVAAVVAASSAAQASSPLLAGIDAQVNTVADNQKVVGKGTTANFYGYYGNYYNNLAGYYGNYGLYANNYSYYYNAYTYAGYAASYYYDAYYYSKNGF